VAYYGRYLWDKWFAEPRTVLVRNIDYHCSQSSMSQMTRNAASKRGLRVRLTDTGDSIIIEVIGEIPHTNKVAVAI
jgi:hypothetical protein